MPQNSQHIQRLAILLKKNPKDSFTKFALALELLKANEVTKAQILFKSVLEQDPDYLGVYYHLGKLYQQSERYTEAEELFTKGIEIATQQNNTRTKAELHEALDELNYLKDHE